ncbi:FKBP-type peptidyl-prolyl cis-trans isomerase [Labilibaculum sp. DW002]|uniref:Peptidyl-prolyl cis-trans isomerase n=1 Tax=Paralabilibaculum antarcticum TaxID=2912572 RepID=A0ABT5VU32_9BACT|nr:MULTISPECIES: FKBP-type peptidyl-prolyl cis-trans isomerase [unclassified Labilibaculum]MBI9056547.1 FKBP-type peptidyl-prolyl cis-trans isomerase [Labilibaculum sp.]MDE5418003.1 FKBP-type peptidyl-prolyl cis-trans isomerase [Labilibaculum sp. DW002]|eukprot:TRINITY_DN12039_c0_g2_i1.p1 TRINITY_DN12039_c0_g2~~TRINITY_DN12039_c0_g2_i1.p1  ORF type:complete len:279 (-),score=64.19 TRINITY_DN12039_c0_g2_i1:554-1390(-)
MKYSLLALVFAFMVSCSSSDSEKDYRVENDEEIAAYVAANGLVATKTASGLYYVIEEEGTGAAITYTSDVAVTYKGYYTSGVVFDNTEDNLASFNLQGVIPGWTEGLTYFKEGGKGMLLVPAHLGYGNKDFNGVPGGSVLIFEITVFSEEMIAERNEEEILTYLEIENLTATRSDSGLYYIIDEEGTGEFPTETSNVTVSYKGYFLDGTDFDESGVSGVDFDLDGVIAGWKEGITYFKPGGEGKLIIPAHLAYGSYYYNGIPGGSVLVFDVKLISINE